MKKILVFGYFGYKNFGDEWLLNSLLNLLIKYGDKKKEVFILYNTKTDIHNLSFTDYNLPLTFVPRWNLKKIVKTIKNVDTVICCGGLFQDKTSVLSLLYYTGIIIISKILKKVVIILGTEFDVTKVPEIFLTQVLERVDFVGVRNNTELKKLSLLSKRVKTKFFPDLCLMNKYLTTEDTESTENKKKEIKNVGLILKRTNDEKSVLQMCQKLEGNYKLVFIPFHLGEDYGFTIEIVEQLKKSECRVWDKVENIKNIFNNIDFVITSRFHGIIVCLLLGIPFLCISDDDKLKCFVTELSKVNYKYFTVSEFQNYPIFVESPMILESLRKQSYFENVDTNTKEFSLLVKEYQEILKTRFLYLQNKRWI